ncbi:hypothetical protein GCG54_00011015 [Colletotrichum gloeosporioides]|uniref:Zn(2)-C6 fungal-type domain-containing protein n=1 Tax=Colletotrichum gloeosporioides TaxID=474922 RepID=A0A8H4CRP7_COLGL|nr:uncharacterized protein GCG54_00011015 [Colletotrichum gloeosporioides]KAF3808824.1 hypothetical protein GCG54_00011015 [Colletotrichum gloeosporioides]
MSSRKKSCVPCRTSKARCSLDAPCRRCDERGLACKYDQLPRRTAARSLRPAVTSLESDGLGDVNQSVHFAQPVAPRTGGRPSRGTPGPWTGATIDEVNSASSALDMSLGSDQSVYPWMNWENSQPPSNLQSSLGCELNFLNQAIEGTSNSPFRIQTVLPNPAMPYSTNSLSWLEDQNLNEMEPQRALVPIQSPTSPRNRRLVPTQTPPTTLPRYYDEAPLRPRIRKPASTAFTAKVLLGQLLSYPAMMAKGGRLPPFIFPQCAIDGVVSPAECSAQGYHQCLPEALAICCSLVQAYEARTPGSTAFVWKSIYKEVGRIRDEYDSFSRKELVSAGQAMTIYVLLQVRDQDSIPLNDIDFLISTPVLLARKLYFQMDYTSNFINGASLDRREWALRESVRRNVCLNFGFELLVDADFSGGKAATCGYDKVAVPTGRYLWEPVSNVEWSARYKKMEAEIRKKPLSIQDLRRVRRATGTGTGTEVEEGEMTSRVSDWCDGLDEFGMLVWMAVMMEQEKREIRLLIVDPMDIAVNTVHASMEIVSLDGQPEYDALSYVWASSSPPRGERGKLYVDGHILDVTQTLFQALRSIGSYQKTLSRRIWVDAVCINQQDHREKSWQILLMASIYRLASTTYIFTNDNLQGIRAASQLDARKFRADINHFKRTAGDQNADRPPPELKQDNVHVAVWRDSPETSRNWRAIKLLLSHPWWGRRWVIQEAFFSRNPVLICGSASHSLPLDKIAQIAVWHQKIASSAHKVPEFIRTLFDSCPFYPLLREWKPYRTDPDVHRAPLPRWMTLAKGFKQSLSRDMVFGLLSLASPEDQLRIKPDYYHSDETVFTSIFAYLVKTYGINPFRFRSLEFKNPLPSWCGIWGPRYQAEAGSMLHFAARRGRKSFKVGAGTKRVARFLENSVAIGRGEGNERAKGAGPIDNSVLAFQGICFDEVAVAIPSGITAKTIHTSSMASIEESFQSAIKCWQRRWAGLKNDPYGSGNDFPSDLCRTLLGDWTEGLTDDEWLAHYQLWLKGVSCWQASKCKRGLSFGARKCPETGLNDMVGREDCFYRSSRICCYNRSLMITARGFIGLAPIDTMVGDTISVFYGSLIPLVQRRNGGGELYSLVGEAYVHGIMYGEAVETKDESCPEREFLLS